MRHVVLMALGFSLFSLISLPLQAQQGGRLTVVGHGNSQAVPDMATITMGVTSQAPSATAALASNSADTAAMLAVIKAAGVAPRDVQTSGLSLSPVWKNRASGNNSPPEIIGYTVHNQVRVRVRDLDGMGAILDAVVSSGANQFNGLNFGLQDPVPAADTARSSAVRDAARKARLFADAAGVTLGPILEISEAGARPQAQLQMREMAMASDVPIARGEVSTRATVTIIYRILPE